MSKGVKYPGDDPMSYLGLTPGTPEWEEVSRRREKAGYPFWPYAMDTDCTPTPAGWYTVVFLDDTEKDSIYAYFTDPDSYGDYLADCGISSMMGGCKFDDFPPEMKELMR